MNPESVAVKSAVVESDQAEDMVVHDWFRFVLSFPPRLVRHYLSDFGLTPNSLVLDPFAGSGTTLVESQKHAVPSVGIEALPFVHFAARVKTDWSIHPRSIVQAAETIAASAFRALAREGIPDPPVEGDPDPSIPLRILPEETNKLLLRESISPRPLHKALVLREVIDHSSYGPIRDLLRLALGRSVVQHSSNLHFGPEVGVRRPRPDAAVVTPWFDQVRRIAADLEALRGSKTGLSRVLQGDARDVGVLLPPASVSAVICSPPYPNEKDYTRTTRLESVLLEFLHTRADLRAIKQSMIRSNTRSVYVNDTDDRWVSQHPQIAALARRIEERRLALGKTSGFERLYARVTQLYFGGMMRHLADLRPVLAPGARLAYVVGDQASYLRVLIPTGHILADLAERLGYQVDRLDLFRTRWATATRQLLREEVLILTWPGATRHR